MSFVVAYALAGAGTLLVVLWVMLYLRYSSQYDVMIAAIDKKQFFLPEIFFIGFGFMDMFKVNLKTEAGRKKEKKIAEIYGEKYAEYRDMKPGNILLRPDGRLALIDFGTMRVYKPGKAGDTVCLGTRGYAAPEQFGGMGQTDARTDIYGLGATLYYLATGCNPGVPPYEIDCIHAMYIGGFPHQLGDLIQKCVQPDPVRRFQSCRELMEALEDASFDVTTNQEKLAQWKRILRREEQS